MTPELNLVEQIRATQVQGDPSRTAGRVAELAGRLDAAALPELATALRDHRDLRNAGADVAAALWVKLTANDTGWDPRLSDWLTSVRDDSVDAFELASSAIVWRLRSERPRVLMSLTLATAMREQEEQSNLFHTDLAVLLQSARYDFNFEQIERILNAVGEQVTRSSLYYRAMLQFSRLGRGKDVESSELDAIADATDSEKILSLLLHGLWFTAGSTQSSQMLRIGDKLLGVNPNSSVTHMRMASAHRRKGDYQQAVRSINTAIALHSPLDRETHGDLKLERVTIAIQQDAAIRLRREVTESSNALDVQLAERLNSAKAELESTVSATVDSTNAQISDSLFKVVEILGLFTALIGLVASVVVGNAIGSGIPWGGRVAIIAAGGGITLLFFWALRQIVKPNIAAPSTASAPE